MKAIDEKDGREIVMSMSATMIAPFSLHLNAADIHKLFLARARLQTHALKAVRRYQIEMLSFLKHRYEQHMKLVDNLASSEESRDTFDVLGNFLRSTTIEYASEMEKFSSMSSRITTEAARYIRSYARELIKDQTAMVVE